MLRRIPLKILKVICQITCFPYYSTFEDWKEVIHFGVHPNSAIVNSIVDRARDCDEVISDYLLKVNRVFLALRRCFDNIMIPTSTAHFPLNSVCLFQERCTWHLYWILLGNKHNLVAPWCSSYHYCTTSFIKAWTEVLRRFKSCSRLFFFFFSIHYLKSILQTL